MVKLVELVCCERLCWVWLDGGEWVVVNVGEVEEKMVMKGMGVEERFEWWVGNGVWCRDEESGAVFVKKEVMKVIGL